MDLGQLERDSHNLLVITPQLVRVESIYSTVAITTICALIYVQGGKKN